MTQLPKGPASHRTFVMLLNILLAILIYWLLGFILDDINTQPGPVWKTIQAQFQDPTLVKQHEELTKQSNTLSEKISTLSKKQSLLQVSISSYKDTMNQLLDLQKASLQKKAALSPETQQNLSHATQLYLDNQQTFQTLNSDITQSNEALQQIKNKNTAVNEKLTEQNIQANQNYLILLEKHNLKLAFLKLIILIPLLLIIAYIFSMHRRTIYNSMIMAIGIAILLKIIMVLHQHFPSRFFKYILIFILLTLVVRTLMRLLKMMTAPKPSWLNKQYVEAYKKSQCPVCEYPTHPDTLFCSGCGTHLFEVCQSCNHTRPSLLTFCEHCGAPHATQQHTA